MSPQEAPQQASAPGRETPIEPDDDMDSAAAPDITPLAVSPALAAMPTVAAPDMAPGDDGALAPNHPPNHLPSQLVSISIPVQGVDSACASGIAAVDAHRCSVEPDELRIGPFESGSRACCLCSQDAQYLVC